MSIPHWQRGRLPYVAGCALILACNASPDETGPSIDLAADAGGSDVGGTPELSLVDVGAPDSSPACSGFSAMPTQSTIKLTHGGKSRQASLQLPSSYDGSRAVGVVLNFHGYGSNAWQQILYSGMDKAAATAGLAALHPEGLSIAGFQGWNAKLCCGSGTVLKNDDVGFVAALLDELAKKVCIDKRRVYATGMSNGGFFSYRLACELSERIAAIAPVAGQNGFAPCTKNKRPVPVLHFHGTKDGMVAYSGSKLLGWPGAMESVQAWAKANGCASTNKIVFQKGDVICKSWSPCKEKAEVRLCTVSGGGHTWPGGLTIPGTGFLGKQTTFINATDEILKFFAAHSIQAAP